MLKAWLIIINRKAAGYPYQILKLLIKCCVILALYINWAVRKHYDVDISVIMKEYHAVMEPLQ